MEKYQEIVEYDHYLFFKGVACLKYGAKLDRYRSNRSVDDHYVHARYYDIRIEKIQELSREQFKKAPKAFQLSNLKGNVVGDYGIKEYKLDVDELYLDKALKINHNQIELEELHGYFEDVVVLFKMHIPKNKIVCIQDHPSGKKEEREDGIYEEFMNSDCTSYWKNTEKQKICIEGLPTGNREDEENRYRREYTHADCTKYWGDWIDVQGCEQDQPTGDEREMSGWIQREYYNEDCSTYWRNHRKVPKPHTVKSSGCSGGGEAIGFGMFLLTTIWLASVTGSLIPLLFGLGFPAFFLLIGLLFAFLGRFPRTVGVVSRMFGGVVGIAVIISFFDGVGALFDVGNWIVDNVEIPVEKNNWDIDYEDIDWDDADLDLEDSTSNKRRKINVTIKWSSLDGKRYDGTYFLFKDEVEASTENIQSISTMKYARFDSVYSHVYEHDKEYLSGVYMMLDSIHDKNKLNQYEFADLITSMVQSIDYVLVVDKGCDDSATLQDPTLRSILNKGVKCDGNAPFGIRTPLEFLWTMNGDCDTRTLLLYTLFKHYNYDVAIINSTFYKHSMLGLDLPKVRGAHKQRGTNNYYFWETTEKHLRLGALPRQFGNINYWRIELN